MSREILFRGKAANRIKGFEYRTKYKNGDWVYGLLTDCENYAGFAEMTNTNGVSGIEVDKETVGQYTGLTDKNGTKIFEGDIIKDTDYGCLHLIKYFGDENYPAFDCEPSVQFCDCNGLSHLACNNVLEVIGNIHDNPELLN